MNDPSDKEASLRATLIRVVPQALSRFESVLENVLVTERSERSERERYRSILIAAAHLLRDLGAPRAFGSAYIDLANMLQDLEDGKAHPILKPEPAGNGGPPDNTAIWLGRADVALGMVAVLAAGKRKQAAAEHVAKQMGAELDQVRRSKRGKASRAVLEWYDAFDAGAVTNEIAMSKFKSGVDVVRDAISGRPETERLAAANKWLRGAREKLRSDCPSPQSDGFNK